MHAVQHSNAGRLLPANVLDGHLRPVGNANEERQDDMTLMKSLNDYRTYRRTVRDLNRMSNEQLADIGVARWQVRDAARSGRTDPRLVV